MIMGCSSGNDRVIRWYQSSSLWYSRKLKDGRWANLRTRTCMLFVIMILLYSTYYTCVFFHTGARYLELLYRVHYGWVLFCVRVYVFLHQYCTVCFVITPEGALGVMREGRGKVSNRMYLLDCHVVVASVFVNPYCRPSRNCKYM